MHICSPHIQTGARTEKRQKNIDVYVNMYVYVYIYMDIHMNTVLIRAGTRIEKRQENSALATYFALWHERVDRLKHLRAQLTRVICTTTGHCLEVLQPIVCVAVCVEVCVAGCVAGCVVECFYQHNFAQCLEVLQPIMLWDSWLLRGRTHSKCVT